MHRITLLLLCFFAGTIALQADSIVLSGTVTQSQNDQPGNPATNNPSLNNVNDGDSYNVSLNFVNSIVAPGGYSLTAASFSDSAASASENGFDSGRIVISQSGGTDTFSVQACLAGVSCNTGNALDLNFTIPSADLNRSAAASPIFGLDLLEDEGSTDIHASVDAYTYQAASPVPEPCIVVLLVAGLLSLCGTRLNRTRKL